MSSQPPPPPPSGPFGPPPSGPAQPPRPYVPTPPAGPPPPAPPSSMPPGPTYGGPGASSPGAGGPAYGGPAYGGPPQGPGGPGYGGPPPGPAGAGGAPKKRGVLWLAIGVVVAIAIGAGVYVALSGDDKKTVAPVVTDDPDTTDAPPVTEAATTTTGTLAPSTTVTPTTIQTITLPSTVPPIATTVPAAITTTTGAVDPSMVDLGNGVTFPIPAGYTAKPSDTGASYNLTDGTISSFFQVLQRTPGESPVALLQEYVNTFDANFDSVMYSQVIPADPTTVGSAPADSNFVVYRALDEDGTGIKGVIDANRRADGLSYISDIWQDFETDSTNTDKFPDDTINALFNSFLDAPLIGEEVPLSPLSFARVTSVHASYNVDGLVELTPPAGWNVDNPGPGRVIFSNPSGQRFLGERIAAPITDEAGADAAGQSAVTVLVPGATFGQFSFDDSTATSFVSTTWGGTDPNTGQPLQGYISVWFNPTTGEAFDSVEAWIGPATDPPSKAESDFLFTGFDVTISRRRS